MIDIGAKAPTFTLDSDSGKKVSLRDFAGKTLVLYFYPKDDTPGCTREAQAFTKARSDIEKAGGVVVGISKDSVAAHCKFRDKYGLAIPLLSDPELTVHKAFGAYGEKTMYGKKVMGTIRSTFLVKDGRVVHVYPSVKVDGHADEVLAFLRGASGAPAPKKPAPGGRAAKTAAPAKKTAAKKPATPAKKSAAKKTAAPAKKSAAKKTAAPAKKSAAKKSAKA